MHWHESAMDLHVFPIPIPPPTSLSTRFLWVFPVHQARALVLCIQPGLLICFTLDNIHVSMLFSRNIPPLPSSTEILNVKKQSWSTVLEVKIMVVVGGQVSGRWHKGVSGIPELFCGWTWGLVTKVCSLWKFNTFDLSLSTFLHLCCTSMK